MVAGGPRVVAAVLGLWVAAMCAGAWPEAAGASGAGPRRPSELPVTCTARPRLVAVAPTPTFPTGYQILDAVPNALATQYPTVYGGEFVPPATPGETPTQANSHFVVQETEHDPALEAEARQAFGPPLSVSFALTPHTQACLDDVQHLLASATKKKGSPLEAFVSLGADTRASLVDITLTTCRAAPLRRARQWVAARWGTLVKVGGCQQPAEATVLGRPAADFGQAPSP